MTPDEERWAEATTIERIHGARAEAYIAERIATLTAAGNVAGANRFREIIHRHHQLVRGDARPS